MRRKVVLAVAIALAEAGCKHGSSKLEGHWRGTRADGVSPTEQEAADTFATQTEIVARGNLITLSTPGGAGQQTTYTVDDESNSTLVLHTDKDGPTRETFVFETDGKTMTWRVGEGRSIVFAKVKD